MRVFLIVCCLSLIWSPSILAAKPWRIYCATPGSDYLPFFRWNHGDVKPDGMDCQLAQKIAKVIKQPIEFVVPKANDQGDVRFHMLEKNQADLVISAFTVTKQRAQRVAFSQPYFSDGVGVMVLADSKVKNFADLKGKTVFVDAQTSTEQWLRQNRPDIKRMSFKQLPIGPIESLKQGHVAGMAADRSRLPLLAEKYDMLVLPGLLSREDIAIAVRKNDTARLVKINKALQKLKKSGQLAKLQSTWLTRKKEWISSKNKIISFALENIAPKKLGFKRPYVLFFVDQPNKIASFSRVADQKMMQTYHFEAKPWAQLKKTKHPGMTWSSLSASKMDGFFADCKSQWRHLRKTHPAIRALVGISNLGSQENQPDQIGLYMVLFLGCDRPGKEFLLQFERHRSNSSWHLYQQSMGRLK